MLARVIRRWRALLLIAVTLGVLAYLAWPTVRSAALLLDMTSAAPRVRAWLPVSRAQITTRDLTVPTRFEAIPGRLYEPASGAGTPLLVFPGVHGGGIDEPRLVALAQHLASAGASVVTVPLPDLRRYRISLRSSDMIEDAIVWAAREFGHSTNGRIGIVGVSFAGGLALAAAGRPGVADRITAVFALGAHADLPRVIRYLCGEGAPATLPPPHDYGVVLMLRESLRFVVPKDQVDALDRAIVTFLDASSADSTDAAESRRLFAEARTAEGTLAEPSRSLMHAVNTRDVRTLGRMLAPYAEDIGGAPALSPDRSLATRAPVFLLHGTNDSVIPSTEMTALAQYLTSAGNSRVDALLTPLLTHADARTDVPWRETWRLIRFWTRLWSGFG